MEDLPEERDKMSDQVDEAINKPFRDNVIDEIFREDEPLAWYWWGVMAEEDDE